MLASCALHNFLIRNRISKNLYLSEIIDNLDNNDKFHFEIVNFKMQSSNAYSLSSKMIREEFTNFFSKVGAVNWQWNL